VLLETETDTERRENVLAARFRDTERESAGVGLNGITQYRQYVVDICSVLIKKTMVLPSNIKPN
jgi:hypothetical protein